MTEPSFPGVSADDFAALQEDLKVHGKAVTATVNGQRVRLPPSHWPPANASAALPKADSQLRNPANDPGRLVPHHGSGPDDQ